MFCSPFSLDFYRVKDKMKIFKPASENMENILNDRSCWARDNADPLWNFGNPFFLGWIEPSPRSKSFFKVMEFEEKLPHA